MILKKWFNIKGNIPMMRKMTHAKMIRKKMARVRMIKVKNKLNQKSRGNHHFRSLESQFNQRNQVQVQTTS